MTNKEALKRAERAIKKARKDSDNFEDGSMSSIDIMQTLREGLREEFAGRGHQ